MFDLDTFVADCIAANSAPEPRGAVKEVLARAVRSRGLDAALPATRAEIEAIHRSPELTVLKVVWGPHMYLYPHDHRMWAAIGVYGGEEANTFYRRRNDTIVESGRKRLGERDVVLLGDDTIHAVVNPTATYTGAIHVYGGDFFAQPRSEWDPETLVESPYDIDRTLAGFEAANADAPAEGHDAGSL